MRVQSVSTVPTGWLYSWSRRAALGLTVVGIAGGLTLRMWRAPAEPGEAPVVAGVDAAVSATTSVTWQGVFGGATEGAAAGAPPNPKLELVGIVSTGEQRGLAVIASGDGEEGMFSVGDSVAGGAIVKAVLADRVLLEGRHGPETLWLSKNRAANSDSDTSAVLLQSHDQSDLPQSLVDYRDRFLTATGDTRVAEHFNTSELAQHFTPATTPTGELIGYRLLPNSGEPLYEKLALRPDDVIITVNGIPLSQEENSVRGLRRLKSDGLASLTFIRERKIIDVTFMRDEESKAPQ